MFKVTYNGKAYICRLSIEGKKTKLVELTDMKCTLTVPLNPPIDAATAKGMLSSFEKTLNALYVKKSARAVNDLIARADFLSKSIEKRGRATSLDTQLQREIDVLWPRLVENILPRLADEALIAAVKASRGLDDKAVTKTMKAATGKIDLAPVLKIIAAVSAAAAAPGALVALMALLNVWSAYKDHMQRMYEAGHQLDKSGKTFEADIKALKDAVARVKRRVEATRAAQEGLLEEAEEAGKQQRRIEREISSLEKTAGENAARQISKLKAQLAASQRETAAMAKRIEPIGELLHAVAALMKATDATATEVGKLQAGAKRGLAVSEKLIAISHDSLSLIDSLGKILK